jgi:insecticidal toxin complex protein TccC
MVNGNGVVTTYAYDKATQRIANIQAALPPVPAGYVFHNFQFGYDPVGNVTSLTNAAIAPQLGLIRRPARLAPPRCQASRR